MSGIKASHAALSQDRLMREPVTALIGINTEMAAVLSELAIITVFDLATARIFADAERVSFPKGHEATLRQHGLMPTALIDDGVEVPVDAGTLRLEFLQSLSNTAAGRLRRALGIETLRDLALWPPYLEARRQAGYDTPDEIGAAPDPEVPGELLPKFNEHATEKVFYSVYTIEAADGGEASLRGAVSLDELASENRGGTARTGFVLRYEQSWTPVALALGNLLHSLTLAPGEATRVAVVDWTRKQGVSTQESIAQSEQLSNLQVNARSLSEITRAVAREAQNGFSSMNANSTVSNNAYTSYGVTNPNEALTAAVTGAGVGAATLGAAGGAAGAGLGGAAGALIGTGVGAALGGVSISYALPIGAAIGTVAGGVAGLGSGAIVGAGAGGAAGFAGAANFGSDLSSESNTALDSVTTTMTNSTRDVESEMLQSVSDRTQQHASSARNRTASIVQEVSQSESESISTRVVTNYNHMFALTVQYYEVVQIYTQRTKLVRKQECVYVPVRPIERWTPELVRRFRKPLLDNALTAELSFGLLVSQGTVGLHSPRFPTIPIEELANLPSPQLHEARQVLDSFVGANPFNDWRVPEDGIITEVWGFRSHGGGPFGAHDANTKGRLTAVLRDGERVDIASPTEVELSLRNLASIEYEVRANSRSPSLLDRWDGDDPDPEARRYATMRFVIRTAESGSRITFRAYYSYSKADLASGGRLLRLQVLEVSKAWTMTRVLQHLNENSGWYSRQILRRRDPALVRTLIDNYRFGDGVLAEVVDPDPVAINGMSLVFLLHENDRVRKPLPELISEEIVPVGTGGVFAEAVRGRANAAERLDMSRFWDWQDSPIPLTPPEITPVTAGSRATVSDIRPGSLDPSLIELRDPQALPAAQGTVAVLSTLQTRLFEDVSGIMQTAQLAQTALQQTAQAAAASGNTVSETLQQGMEHTSRIVEKAAEMTGDYGKLLAEGGLDLARAGVGAAFGAAGSGFGGNALASSGGLPSGSASPRRGPSTARYQPAGRISNGSINLGENSTAGAVLNRARSIDVGVGTAGAPVGRGGTGTGAPVSLEHEILRGLGGLSPQSAGPQFAGPLTPAAVDLNDPDSRKSYIGNQVDDALEPLLALASKSDADFDAAYRRTIQMMETAASIGESMDAVSSKAEAALAEGWRASVLRNVEAFNGGDLSRAERLAELISIRDAGIALPVALVGDLDPVALLDYSIAITDVTGPENVVGGEEVTLIATVRETLPDGTESPAAAARVTVTGNPIVEDMVSTSSGRDGKAVIVVNHGVPPTGFEGVHRYAGYYDLDLNLSVQSALVPFSFANRKFVIPGKIKVDLVAATDVNTGDDVLIGSVVAVIRGTHVNLQFRTTVGGQPLQGHDLNAADVDVNGGGTLTGVTSVDSEGIFAVEYSTAGTTGSVAYVSPVVTLSEANQQAGFAAIQIEG